MQLYATNASKLDAALLHDGVADTLASGRRPASIELPSWKRGNDHVASRRLWSTARIATCPCTCVTDQAPRQDRLLWIMPIAVLG